MAKRILKDETYSNPKLYESITLFLDDMETIVDILRPTDAEQKQSSATLIIRDDDNCYDDLDDLRKVKGLVVKSITIERTDPHVTFEIKRGGFGCTMVSGFWWEDETDETFRRLCQFLDARPKRWFSRIPDNPLFWLAPVLLLQLASFLLIPNGVVKGCVMLCTPCLMLVPIILSILYCGGPGLTDSRRGVFYAATAGALSAS